MSYNGRGVVRMRSKAISGIHDFFVKDGKKKYSPLKLSSNELIQPYIPPNPLPGTLPLLSNTLAHSVKTLKTSNGIFSPPLAGLGSYFAIICLWARLSLLGRDQNDSLLCAVLFWSVFWNDKGCKQEKFTVGRTHYWKL